MNFKLSALLITAALTLTTAPIAGAATFTWNSEETLVTGSSTTTGVIDLFGSTVSCTEDTWAGFFLQGSTAMTLSPSYKNCTGFGYPATVTAPKDVYTFTADGTLHINVPISVHVYSTSSHTTMLCHIVVPAQTATGKAAFTNNADGTITISGTGGSLTVTQNRTNFICPAGTHTTTASYTLGSIILESEFKDIHVK